MQNQQNMLLSHWKDTPLGSQMQTFRALRNIQMRIDVIGYVIQRLVIESNGEIAADTQTIIDQLNGLDDVLGKMRSILILARHLVLSPDEFLKNNLVSELGMFVLHGWHNAWAARWNVSVSMVAKEPIWQFQAINLLISDPSTAIDTTIWIEFLLSIEEDFYYTLWKPDLTPVTILENAHTNAHHPALTPVMALEEQLKSVTEMPTVPKEPPKSDKMSSGSYYRKYK